MFSSFLISGAVLLIAAGAQAQAQAQARRVALQPFRGPQAARLRQFVTANLRTHSDLAIVDWRDVREATKKTGATYLRGETYVEVAAEENIAAFLSGNVRRRGRRWALTVQVRSGRTGEVVGSATWTARTLSGLSQVSRNAYPRLRPFLEKTASPDASPAVEASGPRSGSRADRSARRRRSATRHGRRSPPPVFDEAAPEEPPPSSEDALALPEGTGVQPTEVEPVPPAQGQRAEGVVAPAKPGLGPGLRLTASAGFMSRSMNTMAEVYARYRGAGLSAGESTVSEERSYKSEGLGHGEVGLQVEFYPGSFLENDAFDWLGLTARLFHSVGLSSSGAPHECTDCPPVDVSTAQSELYFGARARHRFTNIPTYPEVFADLGLGQFRFVFDTSDIAQLDRSTIVAPFTYNYLHIGIGAWFELVPTYLTVGPELAYRPLVGLGSATKDVWGTGSSGQTGLVLGAHVRSEAPYLFEGAFFGLSVQFFQFKSQFRGQVACRDENCAGADGTDPDLWEPWPFVSDPTADDFFTGVTGGLRDAITDRYVRLGLAFGWSLQ